MLLRLTCLLLWSCLAMPGHAQANEQTERERLNAAVQPIPYQGELPTMAAVNLRDARLERLLDGLTYPWGMAFIDDDQLLITEIGGRLLRYELAARKLTPIGKVPEVVTAHDQTGLLDVAVHPGFASNRWVYFSYVAADPESGRYYLTAVDRARLVDDELVDRERLLTAEPYSWSPSNFGGALAFGPDNTLFISIGDRSEADFAQDGGRLEGKILRLKDDGSVPEDNPFVGDDEIDDRIYALGVRNPQGLFHDAVTGRLFEAEHGPMGGDEINLIRAGRNYGWPELTYGLNYTGEKIGHGTHRTGMEQPLFYYLPSEAISPLVVYRGSMFPEWEGDLLAGALKGRHVSHLDLDGTVVRSEYPLLREIDGRIRDIQVASDGSVFILSQSGELYRLLREAKTPGATGTEPAAFDASLLYQFVCAGCHDSGAYRAPRPSVPAEWAPIQAKSRDLVYRQVIEGVGAMPKRGLCNICSDEQLRLTTDFMLGPQSKSEETPQETPQQ
ncbi:MAG: PQQ-dependent sugar dehydrogenase [Ahniella sp.]|nr:PQQ-dependent sugar dehydrogenase [Ahniella sp.]